MPAVFVCLMQLWFMIAETNGNKLQMLGLEMSDCDLCLSDVFCPVFLCHIFHSLSLGAIVPLSQVYQAVTGCNPDIAGYCHLKEK